jgi:hypothetical protein
VPIPSFLVRPLLAAAIVVALLAPGGSELTRGVGTPPSSDPAAVRRDAPPSRPTGAVDAATSAADPTVDRGSPDPVGARDIRAVAGGRSVAARTTPSAWIDRVTPDVPEPEARSVARASTTASTSYRGRDHVWIPALGIDRSVAGYACSSAFYPGDRVYRWGCAGARNVYLFGHAHSVFKPLHDAYVRGRLTRGMQVIYADGDGRVSTYAVSWWKVTTPDDGAWAYAAQASPSLTLQTCVGAQSQFRLIVRLKKVG